MKAPKAVQTVEISGALHAFTKANVDTAPDEFGVYALYIPGILIYLGRADEESGTLRDWLQTHFNGAEGPCTKSATTFRYEVTDRPAERRSELAEAYRRSHDGKLPLLTSASQTRHSVVSSAPVDLDSGAAAFHV
jgi:hypothetical protein